MPVEAKVQGYLDTVKGTAPALAVVLREFWRDRRHIEDDSTRAAQWKKDRIGELRVAAARKVDAIEARAVGAVGAARTAMDQAGEVTDPARDARMVRKEPMVRAMLEKGAQPDQIVAAAVGQGDRDVVALVKEMAPVIMSVSGKSQQLIDAAMLLVEQAQRPLLTPDELAAVELRDALREAEYFARMSVSEARTSVFGANMTPHLLVSRTESVSVAA